MKQNPVIVGIDGSEESNRAVSWAIDDARSLGTTVRLLHAYGVPEYSVGLLGQPMYDPNATLEAARALVQETVADARRAAGPELEVTGSAEAGYRTGVLVAASERATEMVLGSRRLSVIGALLGSTSCGVAARAKSPVVVVRGEPNGGPVVVGVDALGSSAAMRFGIAYAARHGRRLRTVHSQYPFRTPDTEKELEVELEKLVASTLAGDTEVEVEHVVLEGHPIEALVEQSKGASLLVVGSRTHHAMAGTLLGSVSQGVLHHAACSVAVVHQDEIQKDLQKREERS